MPYSQAFFEVQLTFAEALASKFDLPLSDAVRDYTTFTKSLGTGDEWEAYVRGLEIVSTLQQQIEWTWGWYLPRSGTDPNAKDTHFHGHRLFGCFYYVLRDDGRIIRPHLIKNDRSGREGVLTQDRIPVRRHELRDMFTHVRTNAPQAETVLGNS